MARRVTASEARKDLANTLNRVAYAGERIILHRRGRDLAAVVPVEDLELLEALEDQLDIEAARKALASPKNRKAAPWAAARKRLLGR